MLSVLINYWRAEHRSIPHCGWYVDGQPSVVLVLLTAHWANPIWVRINHYVYHPLMHLDPGLFCEDTEWTEPIFTVLYYAHLGHSRKEMMGHFPWLSLGCWEISLQMIEHILRILHQSVRLAKTWMNEIKLNPYPNNPMCSFSAKGIMGRSVKKIKSWTHSIFTVFELIHVVNTVIRDKIRFRLHYIKVIDQIIKIKFWPIWCVVREYKGATELRNYNICTLCLCH